MEKRSKLLAAFFIMLPACIGAGILWPADFFLGYLSAYLFWFGMSFGALILLLIHVLVGGRWGEYVRDLLEKCSMLMPVLLVLFVPVWFGRSWIYPWAEDPESVPAFLRAYLSSAGFGIRTVGFFILWFLVTWGYRWMKERDSMHQGLAAFSLLLVIITGTFASIDWAMTLTRWYSTAFGAVVLSGYALGAYALVVLISLSFREKQPVWEYSKVLIALVIGWLYLNFGQYLIIWMGNIAEEITWHWVRENTGWKWVSLALLIFGFAVPTVVLLIGGKIRAVVLLIAVNLIAVRVLSTAWIVMPSKAANMIPLLVSFAVSLCVIGLIWFYRFNAGSSWFHPEEAS